MSTTNQTVEAAKAALESATVQDALAGFVNNLNVAMTTISAKLIEVAPTAAELLLKSIQIKSGLDIAQGLVLIILALVIVFKVIKKWWVLMDESESFIPLIVVSSVATVFLGIHGFMSIVSISNWIGLIAPEVYIALKALAAMDINL
jgi:hypothetical protein